MAAIPPPPPVFALNPADLFGAGFADYATTEGRKDYERAIAPLVPQYDGDQKGLKLFMHNISHKAHVNGWTNTILTIPVVVAGVAINRSILTQYGLITLEDVRAQAITYLGQNTRASQDSNNLKLFLDKSLGPDIMMRVLGQCNQYTVNGVEDGPSMLRVVLNLVGINSRATVSVIRRSLRALPTKMSELNSDILKFNEFVKEQTSELTARGETVDDLMASIFEAYQAVDDEGFVRYIQDKENSYEDGTLEQLNAEALMDIAESKYKTMKVKGLWKTGANTPSGKTDKDEFVALKATMKDAMKHLNSTRQRGGQVRNQFTGKWAWKAVAPTGTQPRTFHFEGKDYVACPNHPPSQWALAEGHRGGCRLDIKEQANNATTVTKTKGADKGAPNKKTLSYVKALMSVMEGTEDADDDTKEDKDGDDEHI
jgi:hypothetical protein